MASTVIYLAPHLLVHKFNTVKLLAREQQINILAGTRQILTLMVSFHLPVLQPESPRHDSISCGFISFSRPAITRRQTFREWQSGNVFACLDSQCSAMAATDAQLGRFTV